MTTFTRPIRFTLNGTTVDALIGPSETILDVLQRCFNLYGARESCGQGLCGCCTVLVDGTAVSGCLYLASFADGAEVRTVEGLADGERLAPVQEAFIASSAFQCGFCTPPVPYRARSQHQHPDARPGHAPDPARGGGSRPRQRRPAGCLVPPARPPAV